MNNDYLNRIDNVIKYIKENSNQKLTLDILAGVSNFSKYHFTRIFTSIVGVTPVAFVNQERLQKAVYLLSETNKTILEISNQCGFESVSTFNALFKKHYGKTPRDIRNSVRENSNISLHFSNKQEEFSQLEAYNGIGRNRILKRAWENVITIKNFLNMKWHMLGMSGVTWILMLHGTSWDVGQAGRDLLRTIIILSEYRWMMEIS
ncbi:helix-turn-helix domain-containing protein [Paenibacillus sp. sgz500992]|uniref:helix-turn-helix domain-containing protein n=1 Tax=Paenibacillus sp. sgz500992 TaxID=3242476 RepID=UPI0036D24DAD